MKERLFQVFVLLLTAITITLTGCSAANKSGSKDRKAYGGNKPVTVCQVLFQHIQRKFFGYIFTKQTSRKKLCFSANIV